MIIRTLIGQIISSLDTGTSFFGILQPLNTIEYLELAVNVV